MDVNRLKEFIVLADCLNYSKAANQLYLTQPVLSRHIHDLEETFGAQLFVRDTHKVELTDIGRLAADELSSVVNTYDAAIHKIKQACATANGSIRVGFLGQAVKPFITQFTHYFKDRHPLIKTDYLASSLDLLIDAVNNDELDLAFITHLDTAMFKNLAYRHVMDDKLCVIVPVAHRLYNRDSISIRDLDSEPMIAFNPETNPHTALFHEKLFKKFNSRLNVVHTVSNVDSGLFYTSVGSGCFIIPRHLSDLANDIRVIPISDSDAVISLHLIWKKSNTKDTLHLFINEFTTFFREQGEDLAEQAEASSL